METTNNLPKSWTAAEREGLATAAETTAALDRILANLEGAMREARG